jgi:hypothetical protein
MDKAQKPSNSSSTGRFQNHMSSFLKYLSCCYHGSHNGEMRHFSQQSHQSKPLLRWCISNQSLFPGKTTRVLDSCYIAAEVTRLATIKKPFETTSTLIGLPQQWKKTHNYVSHALFLQECVGPCRNNTNKRNINQLMFVVVKCVLFPVRTEFLYVVQMRFDM